MTNTVVHLIRNMASFRRYLAGDSKESGLKRTHRWRAVERADSAGRWSL